MSEAEGSFLPNFIASTIGKKPIQMAAGYSVLFLMRKYKWVWAFTPMRE